MERVVSFIANKKIEVVCVFITILSYRCEKWATIKLLDCSFVVRLIGYGLARRDSRI